MAGMPCNLVLVRHGEHESQTDTVKQSPTPLAKPSSLWCLTEAGRQQAEFAGKWIQQHVCHYADRYLTSEFTRARQTAGHLDLPNARWYLDPFLHGRHWGDFDYSVASPAIVRERYKQTLIHHDQESFYWRPPSGESMADLTSRVKHVVDRLYRDYSEMRVVVVCHSDVIWAFRLLLERMSATEYHLIHRRPEEIIQPGQVLQYTRVDPRTGQITPHIGWARTFRPSTNRHTEWRVVERTTYTNQQLLEP